MLTLVPTCVCAYFSCNIHVLLLQVGFGFFQLGSNAAGGWDWKLSEHKASRDVTSYYVVNVQYHNLHAVNIRA